MVGRRRTTATPSTTTQNTKTAHAAQATSTRAEMNSCPPSGRVSASVTFAQLGIVSEKVRRDHEDRCRDPHHEDYESHQGAETPQGVASGPRPHRSPAERRPAPLLPGRIGALWLRWVMGWLR